MTRKRTYDLLCTQQFTPSYIHKTGVLGSTPVKRIASQFSLTYATLLAPFAFPPQASCFASGAASRLIFYFIWRRSAHKKPMSGDIRSKNCFAILLNIHYCTRAIFYSIKTESHVALCASTHATWLSIFIAELLLYVKTTSPYKFPANRIIGEAFAGYI